jgi:uracil phosphoribosyltransferase
MSNSDHHEHAPRTFAIEYYCKLPVDISEREVFVLDPMRPPGIRQSW